MGALDFIVIFLATGAAVNAWLHKGGLFEGFRDWLAVMNEPVARPWWCDWFWSKLYQLMTCRICLTYHVAFWLIVLFYLPHIWLPAPWGLIWFVPVYSLAATRVSLLIGSLTAALPISNDPENS